MRMRFALIVGTATQLLAATSQAACPPVPDTSCRFSLGAGFGYQRSADPAKRKLSFTYANGASSTPADLGSPTTSDGYDLCLYVPSTLVGAMSAGADGDCSDGACWKAKATSVAFADKTGTPNGLTAIKVAVAKDGSAKTKVGVKGKGGNLPDLTIPFAAPLYVQLRNTVGACWGAAFSAAELTQDTPKGKVKAKFKAKALPTCSDGVKDAFESDVDCGGSCGGCADGKACQADNDCLSGHYCMADACAPNPATTTVVTDDATTVAGGPAPVTYGSPITFTATVTNAAGTPTGTVQWATSTGACTDSPLVGGVATCVVTPPATYFDANGYEEPFYGPVSVTATFVPTPDGAFQTSNGSDSTVKITFSGLAPTPQSPFIEMSGCYLDTTVLDPVDALGRTMDFNWYGPDVDVRTTTNPTYEWEVRWTGLWTISLGTICPHGADPSVSYECDRPYLSETFKNDTQSGEPCPWSP
jgi:hypothetical protein